MTLIWVWAVFMALVVLVWLRRHGDLNRAGSGEARLSAEGYTGPDQAPGRVSVVVPAKDEEHNIGQCIETMLAQDYPDFEMIVVDDRSEDRTGPIIDELAGRHERLRAVHLDGLPEGWFGKPHAMHEGAAVADGQWLCFSDADCRYVSPHLLSLAVRYAKEHEVELLTVLPSFETQSVLERIIQPVCGAVMVFWMPPAMVNNPDSDKAYANGAFMLIRRDVYDRLGGHESVRTEIMDDLRLAERAKRSGVRLMVVQNPGLYQTRMYSTLGQIWSGWGRIFHGAFTAMLDLVVTLVFLLLFSLSPWVSAAVGWAMVAGGGASAATAWWVLAVGASVAAVAQWTVMLRYYPLSQASPGYAITYPLGAVFVCAVVVQAMCRRLGMTITWRGTTYRGDKVVSKKS